MSWTGWKGGIAMSKPPSGEHICAIMKVLDWRGHVEISDSDMTWLANELAVALNPKKDTDMCEVCGTLQPIVVRSILGRICEDCIESLADEAEDARESVESDAPEREE